MSRIKIGNPILRGFNPDPSICRVGDDYYIAVSTFEWYPGVRIFHSRDLKNWRLAARPLNRAGLLDMRGAPDSCGVWAPCLSWSDGQFWLVYTDVKRFDGNFKDTHNYLTTCATVEGDWADPLYMNSSGFDPSLFHDTDGRKWYLNMVWDHRADSGFFHGITIQEFDANTGKLLAKPKYIFDGTVLGCTEAPHLYSILGWYYLITAEGGTGYDHAVTVARSKTVDGDYQPDPAGPLLTSRDNPDWPLQRNGHADLVQTKEGDFYLVHLCGRPLPGTQRCPLGRESALQRVVPTDEGWFQLANGGHLPELYVDGPDLGEDKVMEVISCDHFDSPHLNPVYQWLRTPFPEHFFSLEERPGCLRLYGMESPGSLYHQALIARRQTDFVFEATTCVDFKPDNFQQMAGLMCYYNSKKFHYLYISASDKGDRYLGVMSCEANEHMNVTYPIENELIELPQSGLVWLRANVANENLQFSWSLEGDSWHPVPIVLDQSLLSDEAGDIVGGQFTGSFVGLCCHDVTGRRQHADFDFFTYSGLDS